jgi:hypothetical protein
MSRWQSVSDAELDERLAGEIRGLAHGARLPDDWSHTELLPAVSSRIRSESRRSSPSRVAALAGIVGTIGLVAVIAAVVVSRLPGSWPGGPYGEARHGDFVLTISAAKPDYVAGEPIDVEASFGYDGPEDSVELSTSHPITSFSVREVDGALKMVGDIPGACMLFELDRHQPLRRPFTKMGGWSRDDPNADFYDQWWRDPVFRVPAGVWEIVVHSEFHLGPGCAGERVTMEASIRLTIDEPDATERPTPEAQAPSPHPSLVPVPTQEPPLPSPSPSHTEQPPTVGNIRPIPPGPLGPRAAHSAVWTGSEMIVWGGTPGNDNVPVADGAAFDPETDSWRLIAAAPLVPRARHSAVWTGSEMIVWGGSAGPEGPSNGALADGAVYDPAADTWRAIADAPAARLSHSAVWTGSEMVVWGGWTEADAAAADGFAYDPRSDTWRALPALAVAARAGHSAVWTGDTMIIWGGSGFGPANDFADGAIYDPADDSGTSLGLDNLGPRAGHSAVWTGERMIIWGGGRSRPVVGLPFSDGAAYEPAGNSWWSISLVPAPGRFSHSAVWTGSEMLVFGGRVDPSSLPADDGFAYDPEALHDCADLHDLPPVSDDSNLDRENELAEIAFRDFQVVRIRYTDAACQTHPFLGPYIEMLLED